MPIGVVGRLVGAAAAVEPVKLGKRLPAEAAPLHLTAGPMLVQEVVGGCHVLVEAVRARPGVADEAEKEIVLPDAGNLLRRVEALPSGVLLLVATGGRQQRSAAQRDTVQRSETQCSSTQAGRRQQQAWWVSLGQGWSQAAQLLAAGRVLLHLCFLAAVGAGRHDRSGWL